MSASIKESLLILFSVTMALQLCFLQERFLTCPVRDIYRCNSLPSGGGMGVGDGGRWQGADEDQS